MSIPISQYWQLLRRYLRPLWPKVLLLGSLLLTGIALQLYDPTVLRRFIDQAGVGAPLPRLIMLGALFLGLAIVGQLLALPGLAVLHVRLVKKGGIPALAGYVLAMIGTGLYVSGAFAEAAIMPTAMYAKADFAPFSAVMTQLNLAAAPAFGIGYALTAVASYRSGLLPRAASIMLGAGAVAMNLIALVGSGAALVVALPASGLFFAAAQVWYGVAMTGKGSFLKGVDLTEK
jgi:hypothetical protein